MVLEIVKYGHPVLRQPGARIETVTPRIRTLITDMLETMEAAHGVGLAAQQIGEAVQLTVLDVRGVPDRPSTLTWEGQPAELESHMPLVLINPEIKPVAEPVAGPEGCLSFPEMYADIARPEAIEVSAWDGMGKPIRFACTGLLARAIQHEHDHLHGILFIDRMAASDKRALQTELDELQAATRAELKRRRR